MYLLRGGNLIIAANTEPYVPVIVRAAFAYVAFSEAEIMTIVFHVTFKVLMVKVTDV